MPSFLVIVIHAPLSEQAALLAFVASHALPPRLQTLLYLEPAQSEQVSTFPINRLRNLAIQHCSTSHYLIMDVDLWPSRPGLGYPSFLVNLMTELMKLPVEVRSSPQAAVIVPTFFFNRTSFLEHCFSYTSCLLLFLLILFVIVRALEYYPQNKTELASCLLAGHCVVGKNNIRTHLYVTPEWFTESPSVAVSRMKCFVTDMQEPYVLLPNLPSTPTFDENFVNYGYNKVQLIEHLRAVGFQFYIVNNAFMMDMPHPDSSFRRDYLEGIRGDALRMHAVFSAFLHRIRNLPANVTRFPVCTRPMDKYYVPIVCPVCYTILYDNSKGCHLSRLHPSLPLRFVDHLLSHRSLSSAMSLPRSPNRSTFSHMYRDIQGK